MKKIRIDDAGHFYLGEFDISSFVISHEMLSDERVSVVLQGDITVPAKKQPKPKKAVKNER